MQKVPVTTTLSLRTRKTTTNKEQEDRPVRWTSEAKRSKVGEERRRCKPVSIEVVYHVKWFR